ncbi:MAG: DEAD/DEAH box helicase [Acidobacteriota bacterium]
MVDDSRSTAFELLDERVRQWIWDAGWTELRDIQEAAIRSLIPPRSDVIIAAATAAGKTEAAFLPICSHLVSQQDVREGVQVLYVSPLKALINDQYRRLSDLCEPLEIPVHRWHGDVPSSRKRKMLQAPAGILLITPESLEALFVVRGHSMGRLFARLGWVVIDELHAFMGTDRGRQLQSLLHRIELRARRRIPRVGLSATLGDLSLAARYLRPQRTPSNDAQRVETIVSSGRSQELLLQIRGYLTPAAQPTAEPAASSDAEEIVDHLFETLRGEDHLVFANSRSHVEHYADLLRRRSQRERLPNEFFPHHGNLSRDLREEVESRLKDQVAPTTALCTSTLELGIDIGCVTSIGQIGAPFSVSSLRQRLGRSGRRDDPATLRVYISEPELTAKSHPLDGLRIRLVQAIAMVELLIERWCEPPSTHALHLSALVQQVLSLCAEHGGVTAQEAWRALARPGPFDSVSQDQFIHLLRAMGAEDLLIQSEDGTLLAGDKGERIVNHYSFYTIFQTPEEYQVLHQGRPLGTLTYEHLLAEGMHIIFAGRRWRIAMIDPEQKSVSVEPSPAGRIPTFLGSSGGQIHDRIRTRMRTIWADGNVPRYLDYRAKKLLAEGRANFVRLGLEASPLVASGSGTIAFLSRGDVIRNTIALQLLKRGLQVAQEGPALLLDGITPGETRKILAELAEEGPAEPLELAALAGNKQVGKYDWVLDQELLNAEYAAAAVDPRAAHRALCELARHLA